MSENSHCGSGTEQDRTDVSVRTDGGSDVAAVAVSDTYDDATTRDRVWSAAIRLLVRRQPLGFRLFQVREEAGMTTSKDRTIRRVLNAMEELGWLERADDSKYWNPGERVEEIVAVDVPERDLLEVIDERIEHLEDRAECEPRMDESIPQRRAELELARRRIVGDDPAITEGDDSHE